MRKDSKTEILINNRSKHQFISPQRKPFIGSEEKQKETHQTTF